MAGSGRPALTAEAAEAANLPCPSLIILNFGSGHAQKCCSSLENLFSIHSKEQN